MNSVSRFDAQEWAWVSGASSGIGRGVAIQLAREGVGVVLSARREAELKAVVREIESFQGRALALPLDVSDPEAIARAADLVRQQVGRLDIIVPCAGNEMLIPFEVASPKKWQRLFDVHVVGAFEMVRTALPLLKASGSRTDGQGRVVFISSVAAECGVAGNLPYSACKSAVLGGMRALAIEMSNCNIRANAVVLGLVQTPLQERAFARVPAERRQDFENSHPLGMGRVSDAVAAITFLCSNDSRWITGVSMPVDGGFCAATAGYRKK